MDVISDFAKTMLDAGMARLDAGPGNATLQIFTTDYGVLLVQFGAAAVAFNAASSASPSVAAMAGTPIAATGLAAGTAGAFRWLNGNGVMEGQRTGAGSVGTSAAFVILSSTTIAAGQPINLLSAVFQMPTIASLAS